MPTPAALNASKLVAFVTVTDPGRARKFYRDTLGLKLVEEQLPFALVFECQGTTLRVSIAQQIAPPPYTVLGWDVPDIAAAVTQLQTAGVTFERWEWMKQDEQGIWASPNGAKVAWFKDPEGNLLSVAQM